MADPTEYESAALSQQERLDQHIQNAVNSATGPLQEQLTAIREMLISSASATNRAAAPAEPARTEHHGHARTKPLPDPPKFSGKRSEYAAWSQQMRDKIRLDERFYAGWHDIWYLIYSCLDT